MFKRSILFFELFIFLHVCSRYCDYHLNICLFNATSDGIFLNEAQNLCHQRESFVLEIYTEKYQNAVRSAFQSWNVVGWKIIYWLNLKYNGTKFVWQNSGLEATFQNWNNNEVPNSDSYFFISNEEPFKWFVIPSSQSAYRKVLCMKNITVSGSSTFTTATTTTASRITNISAIILTTNTAIISPKVAASTATTPSPTPETTTKYPTVSTNYTQTSRKEFNTTTQLSASTKKLSTSITSSQSSTPTTKLTNFRTSDIQQSTFLTDPGEDLNRSLSTEGPIRSGNKAVAIGLGVTFGLLVFIAPIVGGVYICMKRNRGASVTNTSKSENNTTRDQSNHTSVDSTTVKYEALPEQSLMYYADLNFPSSQPVNRNSSNIDTDQRKTIVPDSLKNHYENDNLHFDHVPGSSKDIKFSGFE